MKLEEIESIAKNVNYISPDKNYDAWNDDDYIFASIHLMFNNYILWRTCHIVLNMFPLSKTFFKTLVKKYIKNFT